MTMTTEMMEQIMLIMMMILMGTLVLLLIPVIVQNYRDTFSSDDYKDENSIR